MSDLGTNFKHHPPKSDDTIRRHQGIREMAATFAFIVESDVPESREQSLALTKIEEAMMWANAGIARNQ